MSGGRRSGTPRYAEGFGTDSASMYVPVVDGDVVPKHPSVLMNDKAYLREVGALDRSYIVGFTNNEALLFAEIFFQNRAADKTSINTVENAEAHLDDVLNDHFYRGAPDEFRAVAAYEYLYPRTEDGRPPLQNVLNIMGDYNFVVPGVQFARKLISADSQTKVFMYLFDHYPKLNSNSPGIVGSSHAMEVAYLFDRDAWTSQWNYYTAVPDPNGSDAALYTEVQGAWAQFAKTGSPSGYRTSVGPPTWPRYDRSGEVYLAISTKSELRSHVYPKRLALWTEVIMRN